MASKSKKPYLVLETPDNTESSSSSDASDQSDAEEEEELPSTDELQVEFEARTPEEVDFHGICGLLRKAFRPSSGVDVSGLADLIIRQRSVGSVVTQSHDDNDSDDDEDEPNNEVFGVATVISLAKDQALSDQIVQFLVKGSSRSDRGEEFRKLVRDPSNQVGMILSERIINMPPQIAVPLYETLLNEIRKARTKNLPFNFTHYVLVSKTSSPLNDARNLMYTNAEEEVFLPECDLVLNLEEEGEESRSFSTINQDELLDQRRLLVFKSEKLEKIVNLVKNSFPIS